MGVLEKVNSFIKHFSGILVPVSAVIVILIGFSGWTKNIFLDDVYDELYLIRSNDLMHISLHNDYSDKKFDVMFDYLLNNISKDEVTQKRFEVEEWYAKQLIELSKVPTDRKDFGKK